MVCMCCARYFNGVQLRLNRRQEAWAVRRIDPDIAWLNVYGRALVGMTDEWLHPPYPFTPQESAALEDADERLLHGRSKVEFFTHVLQQSRGSMRVFNSRVAIHCGCGGAFILIWFSLSPFPQPTAPSPFAPSVPLSHA